VPSTPTDAEAEEAKGRQREPKEVQVVNTLRISINI
jgi:hypothetical protein